MSNTDLLNSITASLNAVITTANDLSDGPKKSVLLYRLKTIVQSLGTPTNPPKMPSSSSATPAAPVAKPKGCGSC